MQDALSKLAQALNVNIAWLMGHDVPMEVNKAELGQTERGRDLLEKCYGSGSYELIELFSKLDQPDRQLATGIIKQILSQEKYSIKRN